MTWGVTAFSGSQGKCHLTSLHYVLHFAYPPPCPSLKTKKKKRYGRSMKKVRKILRKPRLERPIKFMTTTGGGRREEQRQSRPQIRPAAALLLLFSFCCDFLTTSARLVPVPVRPRSEQPGSGVNIRPLRVPQFSQRSGALTLNSNGRPWCHGLVDTVMTMRPSSGPTVDQAELTYLSSWSIRESEVLRCCSPGRCSIGEILLCTPYAERGLRSTLYGVCMRCG